MIDRYFLNLIYIRVFNNTKLYFVCWVGRTHTAYKLSKGDIGYTQPNRIYYQRKPDTCISNKIRRVGLRSDTSTQKDIAALLNALIPLQVMSWL